MLVSYCSDDHNFILQFVVYGDPNQSLFLAFDRQTSDGTLLDFDILKNSFPTILIDNEGNKTGNTESFCFIGGISQPCGLKCYKGQFMD